MSLKEQFLCWMRDGIYKLSDCGRRRIHIFERLEESAGLNMELAKAGILVREIRITSEELEDYFLNLTGGASHV